MVVAQQQSDHFLQAAPVQAGKIQHVTVLEVPCYRSWCCNSYERLAGEAACDLQDMYRSVLQDLRYTLSRLRRIEYDIQITG